MAYRRGRYWYRSKREGGRVVTQYLGTGIVAHAARMRDTFAKGRRKEKRDTIQAEQERERGIDAQLDSACELVKMLVEAALLANGYHRHKGQWRKQR